VVGPPKELFRRFGRLGIYAWDDVYDVAKRDVANPVMAFRFSNTETFNRPVPWEQMRTVLLALLREVQPERAAA
jgi:hypothetical protein